MKYTAIISSFLLAAALSGCASTGPNQAIGTGVGAVGGYAVGRSLGGGAAGSAVGAVAGALIGSEVGKSMDQQQANPPRERVIVQERPVYIDRRPVEECRIERRFDPRWGTYRDERICRVYR